MPWSTSSRTASGPDGEDAFSGGRLFDGVTLGSADVVVEDGRFVAVGSDLDGDTAVDCSNKTLLPGLFDSHVHLTLSHINLWKHLQTPFSYRFYEAMHNMSATVRSGITTVRDAGGADLGMKEAVQNGLILGPRMHIAPGDVEPDRWPRRRMAPVRW